MDNNYSDIASEGDFKNLHLELEYTETTILEI